VNLFRQIVRDLEDVNLFRQIVRDLEEDNAGRICRVPGHWQLCLDDEREPGTYPIPGTKDATAWIDRVVRLSVDRQGRKMRLIKKRGVHCLNPEYADQFAEIQPEGKRLKLSVPESFCRKCPHYRTARQSRRKYACCGYAAADNPKRAAAEQFVGMLAEATKKANEIMGG